VLREIDLLIKICDWFLACFWSEVASSFIRQCKRRIIWRKWI